MWHKNEDGVHHNILHRNYVTVKMMWSLEAIFYTAELLCCTATFVFSSWEFDLHNDVGGEPSGRIEVIDDVFRIGKLFLHFQSLIIIFIVLYW